MALDLSPSETGNIFVSAVSNCLLFILGKWNILSEANIVILRELSLQSET